MKKTTKGALAAGAAAVLLAGGAGTYAAWTATAPSTTGGTVSTGHLTVTQGTGTWTWQTSGKEGMTFDPGTMTLAPGDSVRFNGTYTLGIEGTNLTATLEATSSASGTLPAGLTWTADTTNTLTGLDEGDDGDTVDVGGTLTFDPAATGSMDQDIAIGDIAVTLKQTAPAVAP